MATPARADRMTVDELLKLARDGRLRVPSFQRELRWNADDKSILKVFEAIRGEKIGKLDPRELDPKAAESELLRTAGALRKTVEFLQSIGVPHVAALPYERPLVVLARLFHMYESPDEKSLVLLKRWFWRGPPRDDTGERRARSGSTSTMSDRMTSMAR